MIKNDNKEIIEIKFSRLKAIFQLGLCLLFIIAFLKTIFFSKQPPENISWAIYTIGPLGLLILFLYGKMFYNIILSDRIAIKITNEGIHFLNNYHHILGDRVIKWSDIQSVRPGGVKYNRLIVVQIMNTEEYFVDRTKYQKFWLKRNIDIFGSPVTLNTQLIKTSRNKLLEILENRIKNEKPFQEQ